MWKIELHVALDCMAIDDDIAKNFVESCVGGLK
jgi:hypothetical protein